MSHASNIMSPEGTPTAERTVGELVAERPSRSRIFQGRGIDFCCQGGKTLREACEGKGLPVDEVLTALEVESAGTTEMGPNPAEMGQSDLVDHIVSTHHAYLRRELPRLHAMANRVAQVHGGHTPTLIKVSEVFQDMAVELSEHMMKEEHVLFPAIKSQESEGEGRLALDGPIACMMEEHEHAGNALHELRELTGGYRPPEEACNTYRALFAGLEELEEDLHRHIHLENSVLFPRALASATA